MAQVQRLVGEPLVLPPEEHRHRPRRAPRGVRSPLQQLFGLSGVMVTTASAHGAVKIKGLDRHVAADLVEQLTRSTEATPVDAT